MLKVIISVTPSGDYTYAICEHGGIVAAVCHGPAALLNAALLNATLSSGQYLIKRMKVTGFSNEEGITGIPIGKKHVAPFFLENEFQSVEKFMKKYTQ